MDNLKSWIMIRFITLLISCMLAAAAFPQYSIGLKAGMAFSSLIHRPMPLPGSPSGSNALDGKPLWGYSWGAFYKRGIARNWQFAVEPGILITGSKERYLTEDQITNQDFTNHYFSHKAGYLEIPVYLQYTIRHFYFSAGPGISFKLFASINGIENRSYKSPFYKNLDAGANLRGGYRLLQQLDINLRYYQGFANVEKNGLYRVTRNRVWSFELAYTLNRRSRPS